MSALPHGLQSCGLPPAVATIILQWASLPDATKAELVAALEAAGKAAASPASV
jgi:hypothetical protein